MTDSRSTVVVVVGSGPGGIASAVTAAEAGHAVVLIDDNPAPGGQIWRGEAARPKSPQARAWIQRLDHPRIERLTGASVIERLDGQTLLVETPNGPRTVRWDRLILATGARERLLPFPGWTLPGVVGAGGLQSLAKGGWPVAGKRVVVAGSGPLLLAVGDGLKTAGARVAGVYEQAPASRLATFALGLLSHPGKVGQGLRLRWSLRSVPYRVGWWPVRAEGHEQLERVVVTNGRRTQVIECDALACGFGLVPSVELPRLLGCEIELGLGTVRVDVHQRTSVDGIYAVGEITGIGGADKAIVEGRIASLAACDQLDDARSLVPQRDGWRAFAHGLDRAFALRPDLRHLADDETIVCRCEDVSLGRIRLYDSWRAAKLQTRCGMGPCQGRTCASALETILGWDATTPSHPRPPVLAARVSSLMCTIPPDAPSSVEPEPS
jgi:NADPH-dependent 2,4-dienoyl-CoA reductase/sulfur reductase-like enzyme